MKKLVVILLIVLFLPYHFFAQTKTENQNLFAKSYSYVNDFENILNPKQTKDLNEYLKVSEAKTKSKIVIVSTASVGPYKDLNEYSLQLDNYLFSKLKIDTSILIVISKKLRQIQFQGVAKIGAKITDQELKEIISTYIIPELKKGDYYKGLQEGTHQLVKKIE